MQSDAYEIPLDQSEGRMRNIILLFRFFQFKKQIYHDLYQSEELSIYRAHFPTFVSCQEESSRSRLLPYLFLRCETYSSLQLVNGEKIKGERYRYM